ncbi:MFS transporter [Alcaligenaceae bacterium CGII-47]|nr:MFS transporter [Alcaligenaceae bacterium CGII-47]
MTQTVTPAIRPIHAALFLVLIGICAALHIWKLPPALPELQHELGLDLVESGFLLSLVQFAGMILGLATGLFAERIGLRRCILIGLGILVFASAAGTLSQTKAMILIFRTIEGCGFLMVVMPVPALIKRLVPPHTLSRIMGLWSSYMPIGTVIILLAGSWLLSVSSWRMLWLVLAGLTLLMLWLTWRIIPADPPSLHSHGTSGSAGAAHPPAWSMVRTTLASRDVWMIALTFGAYTAQWVAIIGFLPTIYALAEVSGTTAGLLTALIAGSNIIGNLGAGRLLHQGISARMLLLIGFGTMMICAFVAFGAGQGITVQFFAILVFSIVGGLIPATLFVLAIDYAPTPQTTSSTVGCVQQCSSFGQFAGPPLVAWVVNISGGWEWTWVATGSYGLLGILMVLQIGRSRQRN